MAAAPPGIVSGPGEKKRERLRMKSMSTNSAHFYLENHSLSRSPHPLASSHFWLIRKKKNVS